MCAIYRDRLVNVGLPARISYWGSYLILLKQAEECLTVSLGG